MSQSGVTRHTTIFQKLAPVRAEHALLFWLFVTIAGFLAVWAMSLEVDANRSAYLAIGVFLASTLVAVPLGIGYGYKILRDWAIQAGHFAGHDEAVIFEWFHDQLGFIRGDFVMCLCAVAMGVCAIGTFAYEGYFEGYPLLPRAILVLLMFVSASFAGMGLYAMYCASRAFWRLGKLPGLSLKVHEHRFGVLSVGTVLVKCWLVIGFIWAIYMGTAFVGYNGNNHGEIPGLAPMYLLAYPTLPFIIGSFIVCQLPLHRKMIEYKQAEVIRLDKMLEEIRPKEVAELTGDLRDNIEFLEKQKQQARSLPDWPFSKVSLLGTGVSSFTAFLPMLVNEKYPGWLQALFEEIVT